MNILDILYYLLIHPIVLLYEFIIQLLLNATANCGATMILMSIIVSTITLPLYNRADKIQKENDEKQNAMAPYIKHIKKTFKGTEQTMMLSAYYRLNNYKIVYSLKSCLPLLLQIPFFMAAYKVLQAVCGTYQTPFWFIKNINEPDKLISIFGVTINIIPIIMTIINIIASTIYTKNSSMSNKIQLYISASIFLIILYNSPAGLTIYWTCNNIYSLVKTIIKSRKKEHKQQTKETNNTNTKYITKIFTLSTLLLTTINGLLIPSAVIESSTGDFINNLIWVHPYIYVLASVFTATGIFIIYGRLIYTLSNKSIKIGLSLMNMILALTSIVNYMCFSVDFGKLTPEMRFNNNTRIPMTTYAINTMVVLIMILLSTICFVKLKTLSKNLLTIPLIAILCLSIINTVKIFNNTNEIKSSIEKNGQDLAEIKLSQNGKNVIMIMIDRAKGETIPYIFNEKPDIAESYDGFTFYPNTISYGTTTNIASSCVFGGYEYTPKEIENKSNQTWVEKHDEAMKLMPDIFYNNGYNVTILNPVYTGGTIVPTLSIYDEYDKNRLQAYTTEYGEFMTETEQIPNMMNLWKRNIFCHSLLRCAPSLLQNIIYQEGTYFYSDSKTEQIVYSQSSAKGISMRFMMEYDALKAYPNITCINDNSTNCFAMIYTSTVHDPMLLQEPEYEPAEIIDNYNYDIEHIDRFTLNNKTLPNNTRSTMTNYTSYVATLREIGKWFDYLKEQGIYDNTRIIIVADHGLAPFEDAQNGDNWTTEEIRGAYNPVLMIKDFNNHGKIKTDETFMTNADTPIIATNGLIENPINPFTNKPLTNNDKYIATHELFRSEYWNPTDMKIGLPKGIWYSLKGNNIFDDKNWTILK